MRLFVIGATGRTGRELLELGRQRGHQITAFVRSPQKLTPADWLTILPGDPLRARDLAAAMRNHDAVISSIGPHTREAFRPSTLMTDCARATIEGMRAAGVSRLAIVSAAVLFPAKGLYYDFFRWLLRHHARDLRSMEELVRASHLRWTIARPPRLTQTPETAFRTLDGALPPGSKAVSYRAVASFLLAVVEQRTHVGEIVGLGRPLAVAA